MIDTETKRRSVQQGSTGPVRPVADGAVGEADRAHAAWFYSGLDYSSAPPSGLYRRFRMWLGIGAGI